MARPVSLVSTVNHSPSKIVEKNGTAQNSKTKIAATRAFVSGASPLHPLPANADPFMKARAMQIDDRFGEVKHQLGKLDRTALNDRMNWWLTLLESDEEGEDPHTRVNRIAELALEELSPDKLGNLDPKSEQLSNYVHVLAEVYENHSPNPQPSDLLQLAAQFKDSPVAVALQIEANQLNQLPRSEQPSKFASEINRDSTSAENETDEPHSKLNRQGKRPTRHSRAERRSPASSQEPALSELAPVPDITPEGPN